MNKEVDAYKIFRQLEERSKRANPYTFYDKDELISEILKLEDEISQLTNNWNELEEILIKGTKEEPYERGDMFFREFCEIILDNMNEIKEGNNVSSRD